MKRSTGRILTTHVGSLPRPADLLDIVQAREQGQPVDEEAHAARLRAAVAEIVRKQIDLGIDIVDDGEFGKPSFVSYVNERLGGFEVDKDVPRQSPWADSREAQSFPEFYADGHVAGAAEPHGLHRARSPTGAWRNCRRDIDNLKAALNGAEPEEVFMPAISPSNVADWQRNAYYKTEEEYLFAIADALREEYKAIVDAGFLLQIDDPQLVTYWIKQSDVTLDAVPQVGAAARRGAQSRAARHSAGKSSASHLLRHQYGAAGARPGAQAPRRHHAEDPCRRLFVRGGQPAPRARMEGVGEREAADGKALIPGVISHSTVLVEHPELVAERICRFASVVGRENVIAGADCGFATFAGSKEVHPSIVWAKFKSLVDGARLASQQLWGGR